MMWGFSSAWGLLVKLVGSISNEQDIDLFNVKYMTLNLYLE